jgi:hypothetical protein
MGEKPNLEVMARITSANAAKDLRSSFCLMVIPARSCSRPIPPMIHWVLSTRFFALLFGCIDRNSGNPLE